MTSPDREPQPAGSPRVTPAFAARPVGPPAPPPAAWAARELATLAEIAETIAEGDGVRRANLAAAALSGAADPAQVLQLRLVLRAFESRVANLVLTGRPVRFSGLDQPARERYLLAWAGSRIPQRRSAYQAFKRLLAFLAYADPGEDGGNRRPLDAGYAPAPEPVTSDPTPIVPVDVGGLARAAETRPADAGAPIVLEADVAIAGSGAGGGVVAAYLARAGRSVVVVEAGPFVPEPDMPVDELGAFDRMYLDHGLTASTDAGILSLAGTGVGGGTLVNWGTSIELPEGLRRRWAGVHGVEGIDGPEGAADFLAIRTELGIGRSHQVPPKDEAILRGAAALGWEAAVTERNGVGCGDCGRCGFGCRRGAKQSGIRVHLADAWRAGARIVADAPVERVLLEGGRAAGLEATVTVGGERRRLVVRARTVVVAAGALRTPAVLLRSGLRHPAIGRHLRLHPVGIVAGVMAEDVTMWQGTPQGAASLHFLGDGFRDAGGFVIESAPGTVGLMALVLGWEGREALASLMRRAPRISPVLAIVRDQGAGRISVTRGGRPRLDYVVEPRDRVQLRRGLVAAARILHAAGAPEMVAVGTPAAWHRGAAAGEAGAFAAYLERLAAFSFAPNRGTVVSAHQMGSVRAGAGPSDHPCDPWGRVRADDARPGRDALVPGLWVGDASLLPTAIGVNPMVTTMAMARRVARTIAAGG